MSHLYHKFIDTPFNRMRIGGTEDGLCLFEFEYRTSLNAIERRIEQMTGVTFEDGEHPYFEEVEQQVAEYFAGTRQNFDLPLQLLGSPFQVSVWQALLQIPYGETRSYKQQSIYLNNEKAIRAIASANGDNGIAIIVPCHRVIGANGSLVGYGGGIQRKKWLLEHEAKHSGKTLQPLLF